MNAEIDDPSDLPEDEFIDYSDDDSLAADEMLDGEEYDGEEYDEEHVDDQQATRRSSSGSRKKRRKMFCGGCNRMENHRRAGRKSWLNSYITGLTFGLNRLLGPFKCSCCGSNRWIFKLKKANK